MKLLHIADLHIGKRVNEFNMLEDQQYILEQIIQIIKNEKTDGVLIAGDVYDKTQPSAEAVELLDEFLTELISYRQPVFIISGNHDSPERLGFGSRIMHNNGLHIARIYSGQIQSVSLRDKHGLVNVYLLPYLKPAIVKQFFDRDIETYDEAVRAALSECPLDKKQRNVLIAHQFVTSGTLQPFRTDSESISVGGTDNVDTSCFDSFDYVALGHLHGSQRIGRDTVRYAGSPLKYSFSEARHKKTATLLELGSKNDIDIKLIPLVAKRDMREIKGPIAQLLRSGREEPDISGDYIHATVTDEDEIYDAIGKLRQVYPNLMVLDFDNGRHHSSAESPATAASDFAQKSPVEMFSEFYETQNNEELSREQSLIIERIFSRAGRSDV